MVKNTTDDLSKIERNFRELIVRRCKFCGFDKYLEENQEFEFPKITDGLLKLGVQDFIAVPGMFGGFMYYLGEMNARPVLYAEQSSRMDYSSDDYAYFEVTADGSRVLEGKEWEAARKRFRELDRKAHEERMRSI